MKALLGRGFVRAAQEAGPRNIPVEVCDRDAGDGTVPGLLELSNSPGKQLPRYLKLVVLLHGPTQAGCSVGVSGRCMLHSSMGVVGLL